MRNKNKKESKGKIMKPIFSQSKYGSMNKLSENGNPEFLENYLMEYLDKQVIKWESIPVLRKQMEGLRDIGMDMIKDGRAKECGIMIEQSIEINPTEKN